MFFNKKYKIISARMRRKGKGGLPTVDNSAYFADIKSNTT